MSKLSKREYSKLRKNLEKSTLKELTSPLKKLGWKKCQNTFWLVDNDFFWSVSISTHFNADKTVVRLGVKPMKIDPILWDIFNLKENHSAPISFRENGAFTCSSLPIDDICIMDSMDISELITEIKSWITNTFHLAKINIINSKFSNLIEAHENQQERGAYAISLICSLINESEFNRAADIAKKYESGTLTSAFTMTNSDSNTFYYHALKSLDGRLTV